MRSFLLVSLPLMMAAMEPSCGQGAQQSRLQETVQASRGAATAGLDSLRGLARTHFQMLGFSEAGQAATATLGEPLVDFYVRLDSLRVYTNAKNPLTLLSGGDKVLYPVLAGGATRSSIQVERVRGAWRPVTYGGATWAIAVSDRRTQVAAAEGRSPSEYFLVRVPALGVQFLGTNVAGAFMLTPLLDDPKGRWKAGASMSGATLLGLLVADARASKGLPI